MRKVIGIAGHAGVGKNFTADCLAREYQKQGVSVGLVSLADPLKQDLNPFMIEKFGIDLFTCTREEKNLVRPIIVEYGRVQRKLSFGKIYTSMLEQSPEFLKPDVVIITDVRYDEYKYDEYQWLVEGCGGKLVYVRRRGILPANQDESENNARLENKANFVIEPPFFLSYDDQCRKFYHNLKEKIDQC